MSLEQDIYKYSARVLFRYFADYRVIDYARSGTEATQTVVLEEGPLPEFSHSMEPQLRQLGLPTALKKGKNTVYEPSHNKTNKMTVRTAKTQISLGIRPD